MMSASDWLTSCLRVYHSVAVRMTLAGQRPSVVGTCPRTVPLRYSCRRSSLCRMRSVNVTFPSGERRQASMLRSRRGPGLRAMTIGSQAGFSDALDFGKPCA